MTKSLGIKPRWTADEEALLRRDYLGLGAKVLSKSLGRSFDSVAAKAKSLGIKRRAHRNWTTSEIRLLRELYPRGGVKMLATMLNRTEPSVKQQATKLQHLCYESTEAYPAVRFARRMARRGKLTEERRIALEWLIFGLTRGFGMDRKGLDVQMLVHELEDRRATA